MSHIVLWNSGRSAVATDCKAPSGIVPTQPPRENGAAEETILPGAAPGFFFDYAVEEDRAAVAEDKVYTLDFFQSFDAFNSKYGYKSHNAVLKWYRDKTENTDGSVHFFVENVQVCVPEIVHLKGPEYFFNCEGEWWMWHWCEMVHQKTNY